MERHVTRRAPCCAVTSRCDDVIAVCRRPAKLQDGVGESDDVMRSANGRTNRRRRRQLLRPAVRSHPRARTGRPVIDLREAYTCSLHCRYKLITACFHTCL